MLLAILLVGVAVAILMRAAMTWSYRRYTDGQSRATPRLAGWPIEALALTAQVRYRLL